MESFGGPSENPELNINWLKEYPHAVYSAVRWGDKTLVAGSSWDRRRVPYTRKIAEQSSGFLNMCDQHGKTEYVFEFPSMVYTCVPFYGGLTFVGCKGPKQTASLVDKRGFVHYSVDDPGGCGIYNAVYDDLRHNIIAATRTGKLTTFSGDNLKKISEWQLAPPDVRLWSLAMANQQIYTGDYSGVLHKIDLRDNTRKKLDLKNCLSENPLMENGFGPSIWGLGILDNGNIVLGTRWSQIVIVSPQLNIVSTHPFPESITSLLNLTDTYFLVGTRNGNLHLFDLENESSQMLASHPPATQKENAVWGLSKKNSDILASFADGAVYNLSVSV